jgi:uncharacterized protein (DUF58 family)
MSSALNTTNTQRPTAAASKSLRISGNRIHLRPTKQGIFYVLSISIILVSSINFQNNLGILTSLFFFICLLLSTVETWQLLRGVSLNLSKIEPVFCGAAANANITVFRHGHRKAAHLRIRLDQYENQLFHLADTSEQNLSYLIHTSQRGEYVIRNISVSSHYPFGVIKAWMMFKVEHHFVVYPVPADTEAHALHFNPQQRSHINDLNQSDYAGMRTYSPGDPFKLINWKSVASEKGLYVNDFSSNTDTTGWIDWDDYPDMDTEQRLSLMTRAVIQHEKLVCNYGLRLPGTSIRPHCGFSHMKQCLTALACFNRQPAHSNLPAQN